MPRNKREGLVFGVAMAFTMSLFMNIFNVFRHSGISVEALGHALLLQPVIFTIVMIVENVVVSKAARKVMNGMTQKNDSASAKALAQTVCMVTGMSLAMSVIGLVLSGAPLAAMPVQFALAWPVNFCAAFFWQMFAAAPIARSALRLFRRYNRNADVVVATE